MAPAQPKAGSRQQLQPLSIGVAAAAVVCSAAACGLFVLGAAASAWDSVRFDFAAVNSSAVAAGAVGVKKLTGADGGAVGAVLLTANGTGFCVLDLDAGLWLLCDRVSADDPANAAYRSYCWQFDIVIGNRSCFSYVTDYSGVRDQMERSEYSSESQIMKMQNNIISCCIVVLLCILAAMLTSCIGVCCRVVPAVMVTGVLCLTAGIFVIFGNSIAHEKVARMTRRPQIAGCAECTCYSMVKTPEELCSTTVRSVTIGWSVAATWVSAFGFVTASQLWFWFTRRLRLERSKTMI